MEGDMTIVQEGGAKRCATQILATKPRKASMAVRKRPLVCKLIWHAISSRFVVSSGFVVSRRNDGPLDETRRDENETAVRLAAPADCPYTARRGPIHPPRTRR